MAFELVKYEQLRKEALSISKLGSFEPDEHESTEHYEFRYKDLVLDALEEFLRYCTKSDVSLKVKTSKFHTICRAIRQIQRLPINDNDLQPIKPSFYENSMKELFKDIEEYFETSTENYGLTKIICWSPIKTLPTKKQVAWVAFHRCPEIRQKFSNQNDLAEMLCIDTATISLIKKILKPDEIQLNEMQVEFIRRYFLSQFF